MSYKTWSLVIHKNTYSKENLFAQGTSRKSLCCGVLPLDRVQKDKIQGTACSVPLLWNILHKKKDLHLHFWYSESCLRPDFFKELWGTEMWVARWTVAWIIIERDLLGHNFIGLWLYYASSVYFILMTFFLLIFEWLKWYKKNSK